MSKPDGRWGRFALVAVAALAAGVALLAHSVGAMAWLEQRSVDARFSIRGSLGSPADVAVVALDSASYAQLPLPPLPRSIDAEVINNLHRAGARVIAFDFALERPSTPAADAEVIAALRRAKRAVVSVTVVYPGGRTEPLAGRVAFASVGVRPGTTFLPVDSDGAIRRFPSGFHDIETFPLVAAELFQPRARLPASAPAGALIDYPGPAGTVRTLSLYNVLKDRFPWSAVKGRVVVVGPTAPVLQDLHSVSDGSDPMAGPEIQADAVQTAIDGFPLRYASTAITAISIVLLALVMPLASLALGTTRLDGVRLLAAGLGVAVAWSVAVQIAFDGGTVLDYSDGLLALVLSNGGVWTITSVAERRERQRLRTLFAAHAPEVVAGVLAGSSGGDGGGLLATAVIAGYRVDAEIGKGGMGVVYRASQLHLERPVALKLLRPELALDATYRERFRRESKAAAAVAHPNVVPVFDAGEDAGLLYIVMQLVDGPDLERVLRRLGPMTATATAQLALQLGAALDAAHAHGLVHRDVKPANILLASDRSQHAFLTDFGLVKHIDGSDGLSGAGQWLGTVDYLAPEQITGGQVDRRADVYALAAVLFHCLVGTVPFERDDELARLWAHVNADRPSVTARISAVPQLIDEVIARGMARSVGERVATAGELATAAATALGLPTEAVADLGTAGARTRGTTPAEAASPTMASGDD
jgi:CHASE2 domain-containing sensor protein